jgi:hypothetical protein
MLLRLYVFFLVLLPSINTNLGSQFVLVGPTLPLLKGRIPPEQIVSCNVDRRVFTKTIFFTMSFSNLFQGLVFFLPSIFIPCKFSMSNLALKQSIALSMVVKETQIDPS